MRCLPVLRCSSTAVRASWQHHDPRYPHCNPRTGEFYGPNWSTANLEMIARFFEKYPEYVDRTFLSIKVSWRNGLAVHNALIWFSREDTPLDNHVRMARE